jgi:hypothetical protein
LGLLGLALQRVLAKFRDYEAPLFCVIIEKLATLFAEFSMKAEDIEDCRILLQQVKIRTRQQAQILLDRYILPDAQQNNTETITRSLNILFGKQRQQSAKNDGAE